MQVTLTINDPAILRALADIMEGKLPGAAAPVKGKTAPASKPAKGKAKPVVEEDEETEEEVDEDEEVSFEDDEEEVEADESEEDESEEDADESEEDEDEEEAPKKKPAKGNVSGHGKSASSKSAPVKGKEKPSSKPGVAKIKYEEVQAAFRKTHDLLKKKFKSEEKAVAAINKLLKKFGAKNTRALDTTKYGAVIKELKALA